MGWFVFACARVSSSGSSSFPAPLGSGPRSSGRVSSRSALAGLLAVVSAVFAGLSIGSLSFDRRVSLSRHPGRWYAALEGLVGLPARHLGDDPTSLRIEPQATEKRWMKVTAPH